MSPVDSFRADGVVAQSIDSERDAGVSATGSFRLDAYSPCFHHSEPFPRPSWSRVPRELGYLMPSLPIVIVTFSMVVAFLATGTGLLISFIGIFFVLAALYMARGFGAFELARLRAGGAPAIEAPRWRHPKGSWWQKTQRVLTDPTYWRYAAHSVLSLVVSVLTWTVSVNAVALSLGGTTYWFWARFLPTTEGTVFHQMDLARFGITVDPHVLATTVYTILGLAMLFLLPKATNLMFRWNYGLAKAFLGRYSRDELAARVDDLASSRAAATTAEGQALRKLERDIHDGPQQQLLRLQMDLAAAKRRIQDDPDKAVQLIDEANTRSSEALNELRGLSRGFAPPLLQDRGLAVALEALAERNTIPTDVFVAMDDDIEVDAAVQQGVYYAVSELYANALKHSRATWIQTVIKTEHSAEPLLTVYVIDNGRGGAQEPVGHGLAGLHERIHGLRGTMVIDSPIGGPTKTTIIVPLSD